MAQVSYGTITITDTTDIDQIVNYYLATSASSGVTRSTSGWTTTVQSMTSTKQYLWNYEKMMGTGDVLIHQTDPVIIGRYGQNGTNGVDGNSITSIDEYYQATNSTTNPGSSGWSTSIVNPTSSNKYLWNYQVINYSKTASEGTYADARIIGVYGDKGDPGTNGTNGINTATVYLYQRATSAPSKPSSTLTYTFSTAALTPTSSLGSWKQNIGDLTGTNPIWVIAAVASSNGTSDTIASTEWSTQVKMAQNGTDGQPGAAGAAGLNQATVYIYKRGDSAGTISPATATYTFSNGSFTAPTNWSKTIPSTPAGKPCWVSSAVAIGNESTATLTWNTPSILVEDGADGISPTVTSTSTGVKIVDAAGNETYINNGSNGQSYYTYIRYATDSSGSNMSSSPSGKTYIGVYSGTASSAPTSANSYTWSKYVGDPGTPATQYYAFVKYATDANGSNMQDSPDSTHIYVGTYTGTNASPAASAYQWSKYVGADGQSATQYYAFIRYATSSTGANMTDTPTASTTYVGTYSGTKSSPTASDYKWSIYVGTDGISVTQVRELYYLTTGNAPNKPTAQTTIYDDDRVGAWTSIVPTYIANGNYYISLETTLSNSTKVWSDVVLDQALTDANYNAAMANSIAQSANENAQGAMSQATEANYKTEALDAKLKYFFYPGDSNYPGVYAVSGIGGTTFDESNISTYGFNVVLKPANVAIGYNTYKALELDGATPALKLYKPSKTNQGAQTAQLDSNGLVLSEGGIEAGTAGQSGFIYLSTKNYGSNLTINSHTASNWREIIGTKFGVDADGNLYASNAEISGKITASSLTIGSGATVSGLSTSNISGINNYALQSSLDTEISQRKAVYAVSTTGASTAAKTTESGTPSGFVLYNGATVTVKFNNANSTTTPTLNVNGTGAKTIKSYTGAALTEAEYTWLAGAAITFTYDGSYWRMQDGGALQAKADAAASASAALSSASAASTSASSASTSASNASSSASAASTSASTASTKASEASTSASTASTKASAASTSATNAANSASAASTSADAAADSASTASSKATAAANSATSASNSASSASSSATAASNSATSASGSATVASNKADEASQSATTANNAKTAAQNAQTAAEAAKTAAQNAQTAAQNAQTSAEAAVDWTAGIEVTIIDYLNNLASLKATAYKTGVVQTTGVSYQWYQNSSELTGQTSATLSNVSLDYSYTCIIS